MTAHKEETLVSASPSNAASEPGLLARLRYYATFVVAALCFLIIGLPVIPVGYLLRRLFGVRDFIYPFGKFGARLYLRTAGARVHASGLARLDPQQPYVFVANHQSNLDPPLLIAYLDRNPSFLAKQEVFSIPIFKQAIELIDVIPIDRRNREAAIASTRRGARHLREGRSYVGFPEGTRTVDGRLKEFKKGLFFMALEAGVPIVPVVVNDTRLVMRKGTKYCLPHDVFLEVLPPVSTAGFTAESVDELVARVQQQFAPRVRTD